MFHQRLVQDLLAFGVSKVSLKLPVPTKPDIRLRQMCLEAILLVATNSGQWPNAQRQNCRELAKNQEIGMICIGDHLQSETMVFPINFCMRPARFPLNQSKVSGNCNGEHTKLAPE